MTESSEIGGKGAKQYEVNAVAIEIVNLSKTFKNTKALDGVSLSIYHNEIFGLLGPNGSGKTTLLRILATVMPPDRPTTDEMGGIKCRIIDHDLSKEHATIRRITGYVPQQTALYGKLSALDNLILFSTPYDLEKHVQQDRIKELLKLVDLYERRHELVDTFSGGMRKRLSIICALVHKPSVLFLDEITVGLDTALRREIWNLIQQLKKDSTLVITTHYVPEAENYCDRVALMSNGRILDCGSPMDLKRSCLTATDLEEVMLLREKQVGS